MKPTQQEIIDVAREAGIDRYTKSDYCAGPYWAATDDEIERFAQLIRDDYRQELLAGSEEPITRDDTEYGKDYYTADQMAAVVLRATLAERERCAKVCDERSAYYDAGDDDRPNSRRATACEACASAIRAGETK